MAFYHVGSCNCPVGNCDCGPIDWQHEYKILKHKYESLRDQYNTEVKEDYKYIKEDIDKFSASVIKDSHKEAVRILDKAYKTKSFMKSFNKTLSKDKLARILWNMLEFHNYNEFRDYLYRELKE